MLLCGGCCGPFLAAFDMTRESPGGYKMDAKLMPISSITDTTRQWSSKVRVVSKLAVRTALASPTKYQKMVFADTNGDTVEAIIFKNDVDLYKDNLEENKTYQISNAQVKKVKDLYKNDLVSSQFQWIITSQTAIMPIIDDIIPSSAFRPEFIDHSKFALFLESKKLINTTCVVIEKRPPRKILIRGQQHVLYEYAAIDKLRTPFVVTLWNNVVPDNMYATLNAIHRRPVIALLNFIVKGYYGLSLSSTSTSIVLEHVDIQSFLDMQEWRAEERMFIDDMVERGGFFEEKIELKAGEALPVSTIFKILQSSELRRYNIRVKGCLENKTQSFMYMCCEVCRFGINVGYDTLFKCNTCQKNRTAKPRFRFRLSVFDHTGSLEVTVFGKDGELILGMSSHEFHNRTAKEGTPPIHLVNDRLNDLFMLMKIRSSLFRGKSGNDIIVYNLLAMEPADTFSSCELMLTPTPTRHSAVALHTSHEHEASGTSTKRKLNFGDSLMPTDEDPHTLDLEKPIDICEIADTSVRRRLVNQGKSKIGEVDVEHKSVFAVFADNIVQPTALRGTEAEDDELLLAELVQTRKKRRLPKKRASIVQHSSHLEPPTDYENKLTEARIETVLPVPVKLEKVGSPNRNRSKRSLKHVVIDDTSSGEDPNSGKKLKQSVNPVKDTAEKISSPKRSKRGRVIRPKQFN